MLRGAFGGTRSLSSRRSLRSRLSSPAAFSSAVSAALMVRHVHVLPLRSHMTARVTEPPRLVRPRGTLLCTTHSIRLNSTDVGDSIRGIGHLLDGLQQGASTATEVCQQTDIAWRRRIQHEPRLRWSSACAVRHKSADRRASSIQHWSRAAEVRNGAAPARPMRLQVTTISAVIRAFNEEAHLGRLLHGLAAQSQAPDELILVDSGSTDHTVEVAEVSRMQDRHDRQARLHVRTRAQPRVRARLRRRAPDRLGARLPALRRLHRAPRRGP